ncbi:signal peptide peptidase SppA [Bacteriovorax stolpii]|uniref:Signal peptide peptidase SppA n=1 Tax=Bacteriovorax stolpii TaxID=960 RepID=A0A2K9NUV9_BACTC|nr:signal peptide peptidase SppA [Bacteriovorax stolpii]AUN99300.1 signal peptide peptidase SppA [Bacteriovorax stolpii]QDK40719.1 signal peptide peptidase SppA [Bacteriovorax stolpii]TDP55160.1 signal peptide peptidase A [Bacteriovorax stolpii]
MTSSKNTKALFGIFAMVFVFFVILIAFAFITMNAFNETSLVQKKSNSAHIGVITVDGVIMDSKDTIELLQIAEEDKQLQAIILRIDSPGGAVGPTQEIYEEIQRIDKKKPIYASFGGIAASGGYYLGSATRKIWASPGTLTGSIGVIMEFMDLSKLYEFAKVSPQTVKAGRYKDAGNPARALTQEESDMMNKLIAGVHKQFINDILKRRADKIKGDITEHAQGQIFSGEEAKNIGLVDEMGSLWTAGRAIHTEMKMKDEFALKFIEKKKKVGLFDLMGSLEESISRLNLSSIATMDQSPRLMFK